MFDCSLAGAVFVVAVCSRHRLSHDRLHRVIFPSYCVGVDVELMSIACIGFVEVFTEAVFRLAVLVWLVNHFAAFLLPICHVWHERSIAAVVLDETNYHTVLTTTANSQSRLFFPMHDQSSSL